MSQATFTMTVLNNSVAYYSNIQCIKRAHDHMPCKQEGLLQFSLPRYCSIQIYSGLVCIGVQQQSPVLHQHNIIILI